MIQSPYIKIQEHFESILTVNSQDHSFSVVKGLWQEQALDIANGHIDRCALCCHGEGDFIALIS